MGNQYSKVKPFTEGLEVIAESYLEVETSLQSEETMDDVIDEWVTDFLMERFGAPSGSEASIKSYQMHAESVAYVKERLKKLNSEPELEDLPEKKRPADESVNTGDEDQYDLMAGPSLTRVSHYAGALAHATAVRQRFWGNPDPPITDWRVEDREFAVRVAKRKVSKLETPGKAYVVETILYRRDQDGNIPTERPQDAVKLSVENLAPVLLGETTWGYELALMVRAFRAHYKTAWLDEREIGLLLLTGYLTPLNGLTVSYRPTEENSGLEQAWVQIRVNDVEGVREKDLLQAYKAAVENLANQPGGQVNYRSRENPETKKTSRGRPVSDLDEALAFLELDLIVQKAHERVEAGESVAPGSWQWRPSNKEMNKTWYENGWYRYRKDYFDGDSNRVRRSLSAQKLRQFRLSVSRDTYLPALLQFFSPQDVEVLRAGNEADKKFALSLETFLDDNGAFDVVSTALNEQIETRPNFYDELKNLRNTPMQDPVVRPAKDPPPSSSDADTVSKPSSVPRYAKGWQYR